MALELLAVVTNIGKQRMARQLAFGTSFRINQFTAGDGGHIDGAPTIAATPDPADTALCKGACIQKFITSVSFLDDFCPVFRLDIEKGDAPGQYSRYTLVGEIVYVDPSDPNPPAIGQTFVFAIANSPLKVKTDLDEFEIDIQIQL